MSLYIENSINNSESPLFLEGVRFRNRYSRKIGRIAKKVIGGNYSVIYDDNSFELSVALEDMYIFPEINQNTLTIEEQERFMHLLYDVVHNDISIDSLQFKIDILNENFDLKILLNTKMKNEKYSDSYEYPISKVLYETRNHIYNESDDVFYGRKMKVLRMLIINGANIYKNENLYEMKNKKIINDTIINLINNFLK
jgi:hypothetical protein